MIYFNLLYKCNIFLKTSQKESRSQKEKELFESYKYKTLKEKLTLLSSLPSFKERDRFCQTVFQKLGAGSSRRAFAIAEMPEAVLKLALNEKGVSQNSTESDYVIQQSDVVAKVIESDPDDKWNLVQKADKIKSSKQFENATGVKLSDLSSYLRIKFDEPNPHITLDPLVKDSLDYNEFVTQIVSIMADYKMPVGDITRISSWGIVNGKPVLIDYGLTEDIYNTYYK